MIGYILRGWFWPIQGGNARLGGEGAWLCVMLQALPCHVRYSADNDQ